MTNRPFRFIHASDFHLEQPPLGISEVPDHMRDTFVEAAYAAAERVFAAVLAEEAEVLVLSGDLLQPEQTGPRGPMLLTEQFARLAERNIAVYWAGGTVDPPQAWPAALTLPSNVHVFPHCRIEEIVHQREGVPLLRLIGLSRDRSRAIRPGDFEPDPSGLFTMAVVHGTAEAAALQARGIHYWALGSRHDRSTLAAGTQVVHYPGSPQGRSPQESGAHGCTLVQVDEQGQARTSMIPTDAMRWLSERVAIDQSTTRSNLETLFRERVHALTEATPKLPLLVSWTIAGGGSLLGELRRGGLGAELLAWLRGEYGFRQPAVWSVSLDAEPSAALLPEWYEQETIRGDFLRAVRQFEMNPDEPLDLEAYVSEKHLAGTLAAAVAIGDAPGRQRVLREAALLGVDLLSGEDPQP